MLNKNMRLTVHVVYSNFYLIFYPNFRILKKSDTQIWSKLCQFQFTFWEELSRNKTEEPSVLRCQTKLQSCNIMQRYATPVQPQCNPNASRMQPLCNAMQPQCNPNACNPYDTLWNPSGATQMQPLCNAIMEPQFKPSATPVQPKSQCDGDGYDPWNF